MAAFVKGLSDFDLVAAIGDPEVLESWAFAAKMQMIATLYARPVMYPPQPSPDDPRGDENGTSASPGKARKRRRGLSREDLTVQDVAARLAITPHRAALLLNMAKALTGRLSRTLAGVWDRRVNAYKAQLIVELVTPMADYEYEHQVAEGASPLQAERAASAKARQVEDRLLDEAASGQTPSAFRQRIRRTVASVHPRYADQMCKRALRARKVTLRTDLPDGLAILSAELSAPDALRIWNNLNHEAHAQRDAGDERTLDQLRADIFVYLLSHPNGRQTACTCSCAGAKAGTEADAETRPSAGTADTDGTQTDGADTDAVVSDSVDRAGNSSATDGDEPYAGDPADPTMSDAGNTDSRFGDDDEDAAVDHHPRSTANPLSTATLPTTATLLPTGTLTVTAALLMTRKVTAAVTLPVTASTTAEVDRRMPAPLAPPPNRPMERPPERRPKRSPVGEPVRRSAAVPTSR